MFSASFSQDSAFIFLVFLLKFLQNCFNETIASYAKMNKQ